VNAIPRPGSCSACAVLENCTTPAARMLFRSGNEMDVDVPFEDEERRGEDAHDGPAEIGVELRGALCAELDLDGGVGASSFGRRVAEGHALHEHTADPRS
jgi:hypothetical protein